MKKVKKIKKVITAYVPFLLKRAMNQKLKAEGNIRSISSYVGELIQKDTDAFRKKDYK